MQWLALAVGDVLTVWYACWNINLKTAAVAAETCCETTVNTIHRKYESAFCCLFIYYGSD